MADQSIACRDCSNSSRVAVFPQPLGSPALQNCRDARKNERGPRQMFDAVCAQCNQPCQVPFEPREGGKPVLCLTCFRASKGDA